MLPSASSDGWRLRPGAVRVAALGILLAFAWDLPLRYEFYAGLFQIQFVDPFFPDLFTVGWPLVAGICLCALSTLALLVYPTRQTTLVAALGLCAGCFVHMVHQRSFFWQTFTTTFWASLWLLWLSSRREESPRLPLVGAALAQAICSLVMLGGAMGKLSESYWSGEVLFHLFFSYQSGSVFSFLREQLTRAQLASLATWYSRCAILGEAAMAALVVLPPKHSLRLFFGMGVGMWLVSPTGIIDAIGPLLGLAGAGVLLLRMAEPGAPTQLPGVSSSVSEGRRVSIQDPA